MIFLEPKINRNGHWPNLVILSNYVQDGIVFGLLYSVSDSYLSDFWQKAFSL